METKMTSKGAGILCHPTSLPNSYPIGDLGPASTDFADFLAASGQGWWQMLPVGPAGGGDSPYQPSSAFAGHPLLISPDRLVERCLLDRKDIEVAVSRNEGHVDYEAAASQKLRLLRRAFERFEEEALVEQTSELKAFTLAESFWLRDFSLFLAIAHNEGTLNWTRWSDKLRKRDPDAIIRTRQDLASETRFHDFVQWQFALQWNELRAHCASRGVGLIGDVPLFVAHDSADVWANPWLFKLGEDGQPLVVGGVPPDAFANTGQVWGIPVYEWESLREQNYNWWIQRLRVASSRFDVNRLDHFIGFVRTYEVPAGATTAVAGHYEAGGGAPFFDAVRAALGPLSFIADDLGASTPEVVALMDQLQIPGTRVLQFELEAKLRGAPPAPHPKRTVVYTGNHDTDTTIGWYRALPMMEHQALQKDLAPNEGGVAWALIDRALASNSDIAMAPIQDLLSLGPEARMNLPGTPNGNWRWRLAQGALTQGIAERLRSVTNKYGRLREGEISEALPPQKEDRSRQIAQRAYELYEGRGYAKGQADQDWLRAERELGGRVIT
jgi:4-alpha-glucanotransferase